LWKNDDAQDIVEYTLLVSFIVVAASALMIANVGSVDAIQSSTTDSLNAAHHAAASIH
jgi:hypothetical protein